MWRLGLILVLTMAASFAQAAPSVLHILKNGHVRLGNGPELDMEQFKEELQKQSAQNSLPEMIFGLEEKPDSSVIAAVLAEMQKSGVRIGFVVGPSQ
jgi:hypothetical protein